MTEHPCLCDTCLTARDAELGRARNAERERAAKIAEGYANSSGICGGPIPDIKKEIAAAIRGI